tara:strand:+ start:1437 stop:3134 length:1698 start_codon:yes stop_codon:yes gene_type:complete
MKERNPIMLCLILLFSVSIIPSNAVAEGDDIIIESDMTWSDDMTLSQNVRVVNGGSLSFVNSQVDISNGVEIYVDPTSSLTIENSELSSIQPPSGLAGFGYCDEGNRSAVLASSSSDQNVRMYVRPIQGFTLDGVVAHFGNETKDLSGDEDFIPLGNGPVETWVGLTGPLCHPISLSEISVERGGQERVWADAADFSHRNMMVNGVPGFTIEIEGAMHSDSSSIFGGLVSTSGILRINGTNLDRVGPILLTSDDAEIHLGGDTRFSNSTDDHDIRAGAFSSINWGDDVGGSGGLTDKWERRLTGQSLSFDAMFVTYEISGMHRFPSYSNFSNEAGVSFIDGGRERVIEIAWSENNTWEESPIWSEEAVVTITDYRTAWNPEQSGIGDYGGGQFQLSWDSEVVVESGTPMVSWVGLVVVGEEGALSEAAAGDSVNVEAVILNSGSAAASLALNCEDVSTNTTAQISPSFPNSIIGPGEQVTISFSWRVSVSGQDSISCRILTPTQLVDEFAFGGGQMNSQSVNWTIVDDDQDTTVIPALIALVIAAAVGGYFLLSIYNEREEDLDE